MFEHAGAYLGGNTELVRLDRRLPARLHPESFPSTADTWCATVFGVMYSRAAISALVSPPATSWRIST